jgi:hypothetical protein
VKKTRQIKKLVRVCDSIKSERALASRTSANAGSYGERFVKRRGLFCVSDAITVLFQVA